MKNLRWLLTVHETSDESIKGPKYQLRLVFLNEPSENDKEQPRSILFSTADELYRAILAGLDEHAYPDSGN